MQFTGGGRVEPHTVGLVRVTFTKLANGQCTWEALRGKRTRVPGTVMGGRLRPGGLPHDLAQFVAEATLGLDHGFWGLVAAGATFKSIGRKRTKPGRQVIAAHRADLDAAEGMVHAEVAAWRQGKSSTATTALSEMGARWAELPAGGSIVVDWPNSRRPGARVARRA